MVAFTTSCVVLVLLTALGLSFMGRRPVGTPLTWGEAMVARPGDAIVTVDMTELPFNDYYGRQWLLARNPDELAAIEARHTRTFVLLTFPLRVAAIHPGLWTHVQRSYRKVAEFPGTVAGGEIIVMEK